MLVFNKIFFLFLSTILIIVSRGVAASLSWNLFVPQFFGLPALPTLLAIALSSLVILLAPSSMQGGSRPLPEESPERNLVYIFGVSLIAPWVGYLVILATTAIYY
jgi:hypothetical protein